MEQSPEQTYEFLNKGKAESGTFILSRTLTESENYSLMVIWLRSILFWNLYKYHIIHETGS